MINTVLTRSDNIERDFIAVISIYLVKESNTSVPWMAHKYIEWFKDLSIVVQIFHKNQHVVFELAYSKFNTKVHKSYFAFLTCGGNPCIKVLLYYVMCKNLHSPICFQCHHNTSARTQYHDSNAISQPSNNDYQKQANSPGQSILIGKPIFTKDSQILVVNLTVREQICRQASGLQPLFAQNLEVLKVNSTVVGQIGNRVVADSSLEKPVTF